MSKHTLPHANTSTLFRATTRTFFGAALLGLVAMASACSDEGADCDGCSVAEGDVYGATAENIAVAEFYSLAGFGDFVILSANGTNCEPSAQPGALVNIMLSCVAEGEYTVARGGDTIAPDCTELSARGFTEVDGSDWAWATSGSITIDSTGDIVTGSFNLDFTGGWIGDNPVQPNGGAMSGSFRATRCPAM